MFLEPAETIKSFGLREGMAVADFGAGTGAYSLPLARAVGGEGRVYAIEVQKELLDKLKTEARNQKIFNLEIIWGDLERPGGSKLRDNSVDLVLIANLLFQASAGYLLAGEAKRVLRPGGRVAVVDWTESFGQMGPPPGQVVDAARAVAIMAEVGLTKTGEFSAGDHHYGLLFTKN